MQGVSRESLALAQERLVTLLGERSSDPAALGDALFAVTDLLDARPSLRRALTDPARTGEVKAGLVARLLEGKVPGEALDLVSGLARARWSRARDLADALERLAVTAVLAAAQAADRLGTVGDELFRFGRTVEGHAALRVALADRRVPGPQRADLVSALLEAKVAPETLRLARQAVLAPRGLRLDAVLAMYGRLAAERQDELLAHVVVALPLDQEQRERLVAALSRIYDHPIHLNVDLDPHVLGGIRVQIGDELLDGTMSHRLDETRRRLVG